MPELLPETSSDRGVPPALDSTGAISAWLAAHRLKALDARGLSEFGHARGQCWFANCPEWAQWSDSSDRQRSTVFVFEDGRPLTGAHAPIDEIKELGGGLCAHWGDSILLSTHDNSSPNSNGRSYVAVRTNWSLGLSAEDEIPVLGRFFAYRPGVWVGFLPDTADRSCLPRIRPSSIELLEDGRPFTKRNHSILAHQEVPPGVVSAPPDAFCHWGDKLFLTTPDGSDPNKNGRKYSVRPKPKHAAEGSPERSRQDYLERYYRKREIYFADPVGLWSLSPHADHYLKRGGDQWPPPSYANMVGLTSFCNLKCTICGSQEAIDFEGVRRRSMTPQTMDGVADTIFPFLSTVILASLGEPTLYPWFLRVIEKCVQHGCAIKLESNATTLTPRMIDALTSVKGHLYFSIDATGEVFNRVRRGANWEKVLCNLDRLMQVRDPELTRVDMYPTVSSRTAPEMVKVARVAVDLGFDGITFHSYDPTMFAKEKRPTQDELAPHILELQNLIEQEAVRRDLTSFSLKVDGRELNPYLLEEEYLRPLPLNHPVRREKYGENGFKCRAPVQNMDIGPDGQIYPCVWSGARPQENTMGYATNHHLFAEAWLGRRYVSLRNAMRPESQASLSVAQCAGCIEKYA